MRAAETRGRSLILNGHVDVVPTGPLDMWTTPPFEPRIAEGWMFGRGAGDMKAGLVACLAALDALGRAGFAPAADVIVQSVVEEECTGNGALACLERGYRADAVVIPEPMNDTLLKAQVGVIWFQVKVRGVPVHVAEAGSGVNAIESAYRLMTALHGLEAAWNARRGDYPSHADVAHPINLNIGRIEGGDWASSVPAWCNIDVRVAIFPGQSIAQAKREIEQTILDRRAAPTRSCTTTRRRSSTTASRPRATCLRTRKPQSPRSPRRMRASSDRRWRRPPPPRRPTRASSGSTARCRRWSTARAASSSTASTRGSIWSRCAR